MDYKNLSDKEFVKLYAEGEVNKNDLIKYIQTISDIKALYGELLEACNTYNKSELIFSPDLSEIVGETGMSDYDNLRYRRVCDALGFVEEILGLYKIEGNQNTKPQQEQSNTTKRKGRIKRGFKDLLVDDEDGKKLERIHKVLDGSKGKDIPLIILACMKKTWLSRLPTFTQVRDEFGDIGSKSNFNNYLDEGKFKKIEIETVIKRLDLD